MTLFIMFMFIVLYGTESLKSQHKGASFVFTLLFKFIQNRYSLHKFLVEDPFLMILSHVNKLVSGLLNTPKILLNCNASESFRTIQASTEATGELN